MTSILRGNALAIPLRDKSVDLIVTSPPYFGQRSYRDGDEHFDGQIGSEAHPREFLEALWAVTAECWRVLKPTGSMFVNLGDKRSGSGAPGTTSGLAKIGLPPDSRVAARSHTSGSAIGSTLEGSVQQRAQGTRSGIAGGYTKAAFGRAKSKQLLPHRYAIGCEDGLADPDGIGWIVRHDMVWSKPNGLPESVKDRCRDSHEYWFHLCKQGAYFAAIDEIRAPHVSTRHPNREETRASRTDVDQPGSLGCANNPLGKLPGSVWSIATEPLRVPAELGVEHFAAFPSEWPRRLILGFSPSGICTACEQPRRPVVHKGLDVDHVQNSGTGRRDLTEPDGNTRGLNGAHVNGRTVATITGYECDCELPTAPTRPAVVLDPFGGTGTTAMVARALGRTGISIDLSRDYNRIATWRVFESDGAARVADRTAGEQQGALL